MKPPCLEGSYIFARTTYIFNMEEGGGGIHVLDILRGHILWPLGQSFKAVYCTFVLLAGFSPEENTFYMLSFKREKKLNR